MENFHEGIALFNKLNNWGHQTLTYFLLVLMTKCEAVCSIQIGSQMTVEMSSSLLLVRQAKKLPDDEYQVAGKIQGDTAATQKVNIRGKCLVRLHAHTIKENGRVLKLSSEVKMCY